MVMLGTIMAVGSTYANPVLNPSIQPQGASVHQTQNTTTVNQTSPAAIINWNSFNIGAKQKTQFIQKASDIALNRINANQGPSQIFGTLSATGKIILINQAGIFFNSGSHVDVGGLIASTAGITNKNFLQGQYIFDQTSGSYNGSVVNRGTIIAAKGGLVALVGNNVENDGMIQAELGEVVLASGNKFTVAFSNDGLINFTIDVPAAKGSAVTNTGSIYADGGKILVAAKAAAGVLDNVINMGGVAVARSVAKHHGTIILNGGTAGIVSVSGHLDTSGRRTGQTGGAVKVLGQSVVVQSPAVIDVSGDVGGGTILIGGNFHGAGPEQNASETTIGSGVNLLADAITSGNGGNVAVWSNNATRFYGNISARGGAQGGNGGYVETSGAWLDVSGGTVNTLAPLGKTGTWLLDPTDIFIVAGSTDSNSTYDGSGTYQPTDGTLASSNIGVINLETALATTSVNVTTNPVSGSGGAGNGDIELDASITWNSNSTLTLTADRYIYFNAGVGITATSGGLALSAVNNGNPSIGAGTIAGGVPPTTLTGATGAISVNNFQLLQGQFLENSASLPTFSVTGNFQIAAGTTYNGVFNAEFTRLAGTTSISSVNYNLVPDVFGLQGIATGDTSQNYALQNNIDASVTSNWNSGSGFVPIPSLTGNFNGQNNTISNLMINLPNATNVALFGFVFGTSQIQDVRLSNFNISGNDNVGTLVADMIGGTVNNVTASGTVMAGVDGGGLIGSVIAESGNPFSISNSTSDVAVIGVVANGFTGIALGGAIGLLNTDNTTLATVNNVSSLGSVTSLSSATSSIGGLVGELLTSDALIENSFSKAVVTAGSSGAVGGLVGVVAGGNIINSYSTGSVTGANVSGGLGGLVGQLNAGGSISNSYSTSSVQGGTSVGGLVGSTDSSNIFITNSYSMGSVNGVFEVGGLIGALGGGTVQNSYSGSSINGVQGSAGGFIGIVNGSGIVNIATNYSAGAVPGNANDGFIGAFFNPSVTMTDNYWDIGTSGQTNGAGFGGPGNGLTGLQTSDALQQSSYVGGGWDFTNTWYMINGYTRPILRSEASTTITNAHQLELINLNLSGNYQLAGNVDASGTTNPGDIWATSNGHGTGFDPIARGSAFTGAFNGNGYVISNLYMAPIDNVNTAYGLFSVANSPATISNVGIVNGTLTTNVGVASNLGLLIGLSNGATINNTFSTGTVSYTATSGASNVGGLIGSDASGSITSNSYSSALVSNLSTDSGSLSGGFIGNSDVGAQINDSYSMGSVTAANGFAGGFAGNVSSTVSRVYSTGSVTDGATVGGLVGEATGSVVNSFWDVNTSGIGTNGSSLGSAGGTGESTANMLNPGTFATWDISTSLGHTWYLLSGQTRPILQSEYSTSINTAHQLQLMNLDLTASYTLTGNVDASNTAATNTKDVWAGNTFSPIGSLSTPFTGNFNGQFYAINNLNIISAATEVGLFGAVGDGVSSTGSIQNLIINNATINSTNTSSPVKVGIVAGTTQSFNSNEVVMDNVSTVGGLVQSNLNNINNNLTGGVIGFVNEGTVENVSNGAKVDLSSFTGTNVNASQGGITGKADTATLINLSNSGEILGAHSNIGGIAGILTQATLSSSYNVGIIQGNSSSIIGGLAGGATDSLISLSYNEGSILSSLGVAGSRARPTSLGGLVGDVFQNVTISNSYNLGIIHSDSASVVGGLIGSADTGNSTINTSYSIGYVATQGSGVSGPLVGKINGVTVTDNNNFYDSDTAGAGVGGASFGSALNNSQMMDFNNFTGFDPSVWGNVTDQTFPYLLALNPGGTPQIISGTMPVGPNNAVAIAMNGSNFTNSTSPNFLTVVGSAQTGNNGFFYLQENPTVIPFGNPFLIYLTSTIDPSSSSTPASAVDNIVSVAGSIGTSSNGTTGFNVAATHTILVNGGINSIGNADLSTLLGNLGTSDPADFLFTVSTPSFGSADLTLGNSTNTTANFMTTATTNYTVEGSIFTTVGGTSTLTFNGPVTMLGFDTPITTSGNQVYNNSVTIFNVPTFNATAGSITFNGVISGSGGLILASNSGSTMTFGAANTYTGSTTITSGTLLNGVQNAVPSNSNLIVNDTYDLNGFGQLLTNFSGSGTITNSSGTAATLTINNFNFFSGTLAGNLGLTVDGSGSGSIILFGSNSYTGGTNIINGGFVNAAVNGALSTGIVTVDSASTLEISNADLNNTLDLSGSLDGSGTSSISGAIHLGGDSSINASNFGDSFTVNSTIDGAFHLQFNGVGTTALAGTVSNLNSLTAYTNLIISTDIPTASNQIYNNPVIINNNPTLNAGTGNIVLSTVDSGTISSLTLINSGAVTLNGNIGGINPLSSFTINNTGTSDLVLANSINTTGDINLTTGGAISQSSPGIISSGGTLTTSSVGGTLLNSANAVTTFNATNSTSGDIIFGNTSGASTLTVSGISQTGGGNVIVTDTGSLTLSGVITTDGGNVTLATLSSTGHDRLTTNSSITTHGGSVSLFAVNPNNLSDALIVNAPINTTGGVGTGTETITSGVQLNSTVTLGAGNVIFSDLGIISISGTISGLGGGSIIDLIDNGTAIDTATTGASGGFNFIEDPGVLTSGTDLLLYVAGNPSFQANIITLVPSSGSGALSGLSSALNEISIDGSLTNASNTVLGTAKGSQSSTDILYSLIGSNLTLGNSVNNTANLVTTSATHYTVDGTISSQAGGTSSVFFAGPTTINGSSITTLGAQTYNNAVTLGANTVLSGRAIIFGNSGSINGNHSLTSISPSGTTLNGAVNVGSLTLDGSGTDAINVNITTTGNQTYNGSLAVENNPTLNAGAGNITLSAVDSGNPNSSLTLINSGTLMLNGDIGDFNPLSAFTINNTGTSDLNITNNININGAINLSMGGKITETTGVINGGTLTTSSVGGAILNNFNNVTGFGATNTSSGDIILVNNPTFNGLTMNTISQTGGGNVSIESSGQLVANGNISTDGGNVSIATEFYTGDDSIITNGSITTHGGSVTMTAPNPNTQSPIIEINAPIDTTGGVGTGTETITSFVTVNSTITLGAGNVTLLGNGTSFISTISGIISGLGAGSVITLIDNGNPPGSGQLTATTGSNGSFSFSESNGVLFPGTDLLFYVNGNPNFKANIITIAPFYGENLTGLSGSINDITIDGSLANAANTTLGAAKGSRRSNDILYSVSDGNLILGNRINDTANLVTTSATHYSVNGTISNFDSNTTSSVNFGGPVTVNTSNITTAGNQTYNNSLTVNQNSALNAGNGNITLSTVDSGIATSGLILTNSGAVALNGNIGSVNPLSSFIINNTGTTADNLAIAHSINTTGFINLTMGGAISESGPGFINGGNLTTHSVGGTTLNGANTVTAVTANNSGHGDISFTNTSGASTLIVGSIHQTGGGNVTVTDTGSLTLSGAITTDGGNVNLSTLTSTGTDLLTTNNSITTNGGSVTLSAANPNNINPALTVNDPINTTGGVGQGIETVTFGVALNSTVTLGAGNVSLIGGPTAMTISGIISGLGAGSIIDLVDNGTAITTGGFAQGTAITTSNGSFSFTEGSNVLTAGTDLLLYVAGNPNFIANIIALAPLSGNLTGLSSALNEIRVDGSLASASNTILGTAKGSQSSAAILYSVLGGNLTLGNNTNNTANLVTTSVTNYTVDGTISNFNGSTTSTVNFAGPVAINSSGITTSGAQTYHSNVTLGHDTTLTSSGSSIALNAGITGAGRTLNLTGANDFTIATNLGVANINVTGGTSNNTLTVQTNNPIWNITGSDAGDLTGIPELSGNFNFSNIQNLVGGNNTSNTFVLQGGTLSGRITGGGNNNTLVGGNIDNTWTITGNNQGTVTGIGGSFSGIQNLTGGNANNIYDFATGASISGTISDSNNQTNNELNYMADNQAISLTLFADGAGSISYPGQGTSVTFTDIGDVIENPNVSNQLTTAANQTNVVNITGSSSGTVNDPVSFQGFSTITGQGNTSVVFFVPVTLNHGNGVVTVVINGQTMQFFNITNFSGDIITSSNPTPLVVVPSDDTTLASINNAIISAITPTTNNTTLLNNASPQTSSDTSNSNNSSLGAYLPAAMGTAIDVNNMTQSQSSLDVKINNMSINLGCH